MIRISFKSSLKVRKREDHKIEVGAMATTAMKNRQTVFVFCRSSPVH